MKTIISSILLTILYACTVQAQTENTVHTDFEKYVPQLMAEYNVPALGIGVIEKGKVKYINVFGELKKGTPAPKDAIFNVGSITKPVVALFILKLVEMGQWNLDDPLYPYWTDPDVQNHPYHKKLTTRHVLTHQTGFPNWRIKNPSNKLSFDFEPGTNFQYSGEGFLYLQRALENKFNKTLASLMDSLLFDPLGMRNSGLIWDKKRDSQRYDHWHGSDGELYNPSTPEFRPAAVDPAGSGQARLAGQLAEQFQLADCRLR